MVWIHPKERRKPAKKQPPLFVNKQWQQCYLDFLSQVRTRNPIAGTAHNYDLLLRQFFVDPKKTPNEYLQQDVERWLRAPHLRTGKPTSASLRNCKLNALTCFYKYAANYEIKSRNTIRPLLTRRPPTSGVMRSKDSFRSRAMSDDDLIAFFAAIDQHCKNPIQRKRDRALFLMYLWSARRKREIYELLWGNIEQVRIYRGGQLSDAWIYHWRGKGHVAIDDSAEMPEDAMIALREYLEADGRWGNMSANDPLFPGASWGCRADTTMSKSNVHRLFLRYAGLAGIAANGVHCFRHTRAVATYQETGNDIMVVNKLLRHSSLDMTRRYVEQATPQADETAPRLKKRFGRL